MHLLPLTIEENFNVHHFLLRGTVDCTSLEKLEGLDSGFDGVVRRESWAEPAGERQRDCVCCV